MSHPEASPNEGQEIKSPKASQVRMEPSNLSHSPLQNPPPTSGTKRRRSSSSPESVRKRPSLLPEPTPTPTPLKPPLPESSWHCSNCGRPCWGCFSPPEVPPEIASLDEEEDIDQLRMPSAPPTPSQGACTTKSCATQDTNTASNSKKRRAIDAGLVFVGPKEKDFQNRILDHIGVYISGTRAEKLEPSQVFTTKSTDSKSRLIIHKNDAELEEIRQDFDEYEARGYDEQTLSTICNDSIVLRDRFVNTTFVGEDQVITTSVRREKWRPKKEGPSIPIGKYTYDWDIEPDTTYSVSMRMFDVKHRRELVQDTCYPWLAERFAVCPYLTIEYKCTQKGGKFSDAKYQITVASVIWLFQRKEIRQALGRTLSDLRHYSITFIDSTYTIWEARFRDGCYYVHDLSRGDLTRMDGLKLYIEWSNAIHSWGLGANADSFKSDVEALLEKRRSQQAFPTPPSTDSTRDARQQSGIV